MKFKIKSLLLVSLSISMLLLSGCGNDTSNNVSDNSNNTNTTDNSAAENSTNNNSNNTNSDETLCECVYTKNNKSNIKYLEEITTDDLIPDNAN